MKQEYRWSDEDILLWEQARGTMPPDERLGTEWLAGCRGDYEAPAIVYEGEVTTRAGSGIPKPKDTDVLPERLFGGGD